MEVTLPLLHITTHTCTHTYMQTHITLICYCSRHSIHNECYEWHNRWKLATYFGSADEWGTHAPKKKPSTKEVCCVCCQAITIGKDDALFFSDNCQQWLHPYCVCVSIKCYKDSKDNDAPFPLLLLQQRQKPIRNSNAQEHRGTPQAGDKYTQIVSFCSTFEGSSSGGPAPA